MRMPITRLPMVCPRVDSRYHWESTRHPSTTLATASTTHARVPASAVPAWLSHGRFCATLAKAPKVRPRLAPAATLQARITGTAMRASMKTAARRTVRGARAGSGAAKGRFIAPSS